MKTFTFVSLSLLIFLLLEHVPELYSTKQYLSNAATVHTYKTQFLHELPSISTQTKTENYTSVTLENFQALSLSEA